MNKKVLRNLSYGVYAVSALGENRMSGCIANSIMQITSSPATLAVSMNHDNYTHECIEKSGMFAVSILSEKTDPNIISQLGFQSSRDVDKFMNVPFITKAYDYWNNFTVDANLRNEIKKTGVTIYER